MISTYSNSGEISHGTNEYIFDTQDEVKLLPIGAEQGSTAFCIETKKLYIANSKGEWIEL